MERGLAFVLWQTHNPLPMVQRRFSSGTSASQGAMPRTVRAVLVTGASGGIGRALCLAFAKAGWSIGVHYYQNKTAAEDTIRQIQESGSAGELFQADIRNQQAVRQMVESYSRQATVPSVFVCNAGIGTSQLVLRQSEAAWANVIATNLTGTFHCLRAMAPPLLAQGGGSIIVIGSHAGFHGSIGQAAYAASKAGLIGLVKTAAKEWGPQNLRVNLVLPGWQKTGLSEGTMPETDGWSDHALRRPASIEEVASTVLYLAQLKDVSGQVWNCDSRNL
jgi:3-oxoacyl-[acyl-carrier protein] reductase